MNNRRKFHRIPSSTQPDSCTVLVDNVQLQGSIGDESITGAKLADLDLLMLPYDKEFSLKYRDQTVSVRARHVSRLPSGSFVVGVIRNDALESAQFANKSAMLINCYVKHGAAFVICMPIHIESEEKTLIQLWDGVQFRVPRSQLCPLTRMERFEMLLHNERCLDYTASMYGFNNPTREMNRHQIFEHEFGTYHNCPVAKMMLAEQSS